MLGFGMPTKVSAPAYTMGPKGPDEHDPRTPGPGRYDEVKLDTYINKAPNYSMLGKTHYLGGVCVVCTYRDGLTTEYRTYLT